MPLVGDTLKLLTTLIHGRNECAACKDFTALGTNGVAAYFKMKHGTPPPAAHREAGFSQLWFDADGALHVLQADGTDAKVVLEENGD